MLARACALVRFSLPNMLRSNVAIVWPVLANGGPAMLGSGCVEMLRSFGRGFILVRSNFNTHFGG